MKTRKHILVGLVGKKGVGKDTIYEILRDVIVTDRLVLRYAFADALKEELASVLGMTVKDLEELKNTDIIRRFLQWYGTEYKRAEDPLYWTTKFSSTWTNIVTSEPRTLTIVTDVRFLNEAESIREKGGILFRVERGPKTYDAHASETEQDKIKVDGWIPNHDCIGRLRYEIKCMWIIILDGAYGQ